MTARLVLLLALVAAEASAQSTTTRCRPVRYPTGGIECETEPTDRRGSFETAVDGFFDGLRRGMEARAARERASLSSERAALERERRDLAAKKYADRATDILNEALDSARVSGAPADSLWKEASRPLRLLFEVDEEPRDAEMRALVKPIARGYRLWGDEFYDRAFGVYVDVADSLKFTGDDRKLIRELVLTTVRPMFRKDLSTPTDSMRAAVWLEVKKLRRDLDKPEPIPPPASDPIGERSIRWRAPTAR